MAILITRVIEINSVNLISLPLVLKKQQKKKQQKTKNKKKNDSTGNTYVRGWIRPRTDTYLERVTSTNLHERVWTEYKRALSARAIL